MCMKTHVAIRYMYLLEGLMLHECLTSMGGSRRGDVFPSMKLKIIYGLKKSISRTFYMYMHTVAQGEKPVSKGVRVGGANAP